MWPSRPLSAAWFQVLEPIRRTVRPLMFLLVALALLSGSAFAAYGYETLFGDRPRSEFERYGMSSMRTFVGSAQALGAVGVLLGLAVPLLGAAAALGLTLMMVLGLIVRYRIHDAPRLMVPAASLAILNGTLVVLFLLQ